MAVDTEQLTKKIISLLEPFLPYIVKAGKKVDKPTFEKIYQQFSIIPWKDIRKLWKRLKKRLDVQSEGTESLQVFLQDPDNKDALANLRLQVSKILMNDAVFAIDASALVEKIQAAKRISIPSNIADGVHLIGSSDGFIAHSGGFGHVERKVPANLNKIVAVLGRKYFKVSVSHPKFVSKRFEVPFLIHLYFEELAPVVKAEIKRIIGEGFDEHIYHTDLKLGETIKVKLYSPDIIFPEPIAKKLDTPLSSMTFLGKPTDTCQTGEHKIVLSILDHKSGLEYRSETFSVKVVDFAFDHVSRPFLSRAAAVVLSVGSFSMFILTLLEQIDKTIGLTSGTAAGVLAAAIYTNFYNLYQRVRPNTP